MKLPDNAFYSRLHDLELVRDTATPYLTEQDLTYIHHWIINCKLAYENNDFDDIDRLRRNWGYWSFSRYPWAESITGFISEILAMCHCVKYSFKNNVKYTLAPYMELYQKAGIDIIAEYPAQYGKQAYKVAIQVKSGKFVREGSNYLLYTYSDWCKQSPLLESFNYQRIAVIDEKGGYILISDHGMFCEQVNKSINNIINIKQLCFGNHNTFSNILGTFIH